MKTINNEQFGQFLTQLRKEKELTQKQLAEKLYISDKAVSKWERGLSLPDISLLMPLATLFNVTTTELLSGKRINSDIQLTVEEVESLVAKTIIMSKEENEKSVRAKQQRKLIFLSGIIICSLELLFFVSLGYSLDYLYKNLATVELLMLIFGTYFTFFAKDVLPVYYDENKISFYHDGVFRMNIPGVSFNNSNWKYILKVTQISIMSIFILFPLLFFTISYSSPLLWENCRPILVFSSLLAMLIPVYVTGKKYE